VSHLKEIRVQTASYLQLTPSAFFLNLFMDENCFNLDRTTSPSDTFEALSAFLSQGCSRTCFAVNRVRGSGSSILLTRSFAFWETLGHGSLCKLIPPLSIDCAIFSSESPQNGGKPQRRMCRMTPALHTSISGP